MTGIIRKILNSPKIPWGYGSFEKYNNIQNEYEKDILYIKDVLKIVKDDSFSVSCLKERYTRYFNMLMVLLEKWGDEKESDIGCISDIVKAIEIGGRKKICEAAGGISDRAKTIEIFRVEKELTKAFKKIERGSQQGFREYADEINYILRKDKLTIFPYDFVEKYDNSQINVFRDNDSGLTYVIHDGKKLFFPETNENNTREMYNSLLAEQDKDSPHRYFRDNHLFEEGSIFVDVGSAEGMISLDIIEKAKEVYLIECDDKWIDALKSTFGDYMQKVHLIKAMAGKYDFEQTRSLNTILENIENERIYLKLDVEGMALDVLQGCMKVLQKNDCRVMCAVYHTDEEESEVSQLLERAGYSTELGERMMLYWFGDIVLKNGKYRRIRPPYFRHGMVYARK